MALESILYIKLDEEIIDPRSFSKAYNSLKDYYGEKNHHNTSRASGFDLYIPYDVSIEPHARGCIVDMGFKCEMIDPTHRNQAFMIALRSSTAATTPIRLANSIGIIDEDYRGNIKLLLDNISSECITLEKGRRIAQIILPSLSHFTFQLTDTISSTARGDGGIGSTGK